MQIPDDTITTPIALKDQYFDLPGLNAYSCIPVPTLRDYIKRDGMPCFKLRGKILVKRSEFDAWMQANVAEHKVPGYAIVNISLKTSKQPPGSKAESG